MKEIVKALKAVEHLHLFSVHDIRAVLASETLGAHDWPKSEEISEQAKAILQAAARRGWVRSRTGYPGKWETTPRFYLNRPRKKGE